MEEKLSVRREHAANNADMLTLERKEETHNNKSVYGRLSVSPLSIEGTQKKMKLYHTAEEFRKPQLLTCFVIKLA